MSHCQKRHQKGQKIQITLHERSQSSMKEDLWCFNQAGVVWDPKTFAWIRVCLAELFHAACSDLFSPNIASHQKLLVSRLKTHTEHNLSIKILNTHYNIFQDCWTRFNVHRKAYVNSIHGCDEFWFSSAGSRDATHCVPLCFVDGTKVLLQWLADSFNEVFIAYFPTADLPPSV